MYMISLSRSSRESAWLQNVKAVVILSINAFGLGLEVETEALSPMLFYQC